MNNLHNYCLSVGLSIYHCGPNESLLLHGEAVISKHLKIDEEAQTENNFCCMRTILFISCITYLIPIFCAQGTLCGSIFPLLTNFDSPSPIFSPLPPPPNVIYFEASHLP